MVKKYDFTNEIIEFDGYLMLYRIRALKNFGKVKKGDLGGWIEHEGNLSHEGDCWVYDDAKVYYGAKIYDSAKVYDNAQIYGNVIIDNHSRIYGDVRIFDNSKTCQQAMTARGVSSEKYIIPF
ncbi:NDP-sugar pyrophosphorylase family protein [Bartonella silvatica]|uniref:NDP-sugar pyrophosphorylase family protein n=1 Tax=Bartonella silvatica TaxID=357760 RepID=A0ABV2HHR6_9HYPH